MSGYVLSIDCGTQSIRGLIFDKSGNLLAKEKRIFDPPYISLYPQWAERDANLYWEDMCFVTNTLKKDYSEIFEKLECITVTTQRDTCVLIDGNGEVLRPAILWLDKRKINKMKPINSFYMLGTGIIGMNKVIEEFNKGCHAHWIQEKEPDIWEKTFKYLLLSTFFNFRLTGEFIDTTSAQTGHMPFNYKKKKWDGAFGLKKQIFQIPIEKLYKLVEATTVMGYITSKASEETGLPCGLPLIASGSDKACETLGVGCLDNNTGSISLGSQATIETTTEKYYETNRFIPPFPAVIPGKYNPEINIYRGYWMISWFISEFGLKEELEAKKNMYSPEELLDKRINEIPPGSNGLILQPFWGNEIKRPESRGAIIGFNENHSRIHIYRAIIEGIGYALKDGKVRIEEKSGEKIRRLAISGGGSNSDSICQITSDIFNTEVYRVQTYETSGLGAAIAAYVGMGVFNSFEESVESMVHESTVFSPNSNNSEIYNNLYSKVYKNIYNRLKPLYESIEDISLI